MNINPNKQLKAAFLDRDGVINADTGYVYKRDDFVFLPGVFEACQKLQSLNYAIIIVTNQSGIGRGYYTEADFHTLSDWMQEQFLANGITIKAVYFSPYHAEKGIGQYKRDSACRKPGPKMILDAVQAHNIDLGASLLIGDKDSDIQAGKNAGVRHCYRISPQHYSSLLDVVDNGLGCLS